jgi:hypothetical protein
MPLITALQIASVLIVADGAFDGAFTVTVPERIGGVIEPQLVAVQILPKNATFCLDLFD